MPAALTFATLTSLGGIVILWVFLNPLSGILALALLLYVLVYTPMKRISPFAVFMGAFPMGSPPAFRMGCFNRCNGF